MLLHFQAVPFLNSRLRFFSSSDNETILFFSWSLLHFSSAEQSSITSACLFAISYTAQALTSILLTPDATPDLQLRSWFLRCYVMCVPPQSSTLKLPQLTMRTVSPYFSPKSAICPALRCLYIVSSVSTSSNLLISFVYHYQLLSCLHNSKGEVKS